MCGGGDDSAMVIAELYERGLEPDEILFADTGSEFPHTYKFIKFLTKWCVARNWSRVTVLRKVDKFKKPLSVIHSAKVANTIPAAAFGAKTCSIRFKTETADLHFNNDPNCWKAWGTYREIKNKKTGEIEVKGKGFRLDSHTGSILRIIGINADEIERIESWAPEHKWVQTFPLFDLGIGERESDAVARVGLYYPGKSSCYCCPHLTGQEVDMLRREYPHLYEEIKQLEANFQKEKTNSSGPKGLFRRQTIQDKLDAFEKGEREQIFTQQRCGSCHG